MNTRSDDNTYKVGTQIRAKANPGLGLIIHQYYQRIYYCGVLTNPEQKHLAYYEHELIPPATQNDATK